MNGYFLVDMKLILYFDSYWISSTSQSIFSLLRKHNDRKVFFSSMHLKKKKKKIDFKIIMLNLVHWSFLFGRKKKTILVKRQVLFIKFFEEFCIMKKYCSSIYFAILFSDIFINRMLRYQNPVEGTISWVLQKLKTNLV